MAANEDDPPRPTIGDAYNRIPLPSASTHIRLLHVYPSNNSGDAHLSAPLSCFFSIASIDSPPPYKALSYVWGNPGLECPLHLDGSPHLVTESLDTALRHLRHESEELTLWVDQLCINQSDAVEKSAQISLMRDVYSGAEEVVSWLGPEADSSDLVMDAWNKIGAEAEGLDMEGYYAKERLPLLMALIKEVDPNPEDAIAMAFVALRKEACAMYKTILGPLDAWFRRTYFTRIWVVQEFALARNAVFVCGSKTANRGHVMLALQVFQLGITLEPDFDNFYEEVNHLNSRSMADFFGAWRRRMKFDRGDGPGDGLFQLLKAMHVSNTMGTSDPRDRVYALMGLAVDATTLGIRPDCDAPVDRVLCEAAKAIIKAGKVEMLSYAQSPKDIGGLPSWVPDWGHTLRPPYYTVYENVQEHVFFAGGPAPPVVPPTSDPRVLGLEGFVVDVVEEAGTPWRDGEFDHVRYRAGLSEVTRFCEKSASKAQPISKSADRRAEAHWRIPVTDLSSYQWATMRSGASMRASYEALLELLDMGEAMPDGVKGEAQKAKEADLLERSAEYRQALTWSQAIGMCPFITVRGYVGLGPGAVRAGDTLVVFKGARVPYVLRGFGNDAGTGEERYQLVGEAYCDGIMDGEILETASAEEFYLV